MADYDTWGISWLGPTVSWHYSGDEQFRADIQRAMDRWDALIDIDFVYTNSAADADITMSFEYMDGAYGVLGEAGGPAYSVDGTNFYFSGDSTIRFDSAEPWYWSQLAGGMVLQTGVSFYALALHEIGHALGLAHSTNPGTIMYPILGYASDVSYWDEIGILSIYQPEGHHVNTAPVATVDDLSVEAGGWTKITDVANIWDPDGDTITLYELWNGAGEATTWWADGQYVDASNGYQTSNLDSIWFKGHDWAGSQNLWIRAFDGNAWSEWDQFAINTHASSNQAPGTYVDDVWVKTGVWTQLADVSSFWDNDGDAIVSYELWNADGDTTTWWADGNYVDASNGYQTSDLNGIWFKGAESIIDQNLWVRAFDGTDWGEWHEFTLHTNSYNQAPVVEIESLWAPTDQWISLEWASNIWDPDGDAITKYELWNVTGENTTWWVDGQFVDASNGFVTDDLIGVAFQAQDWVGGQDLWVRAFDGTDWGQWDQFTVNTYLV